MSKQVHEVRGQSIIRVSNQDEIPEVQEANSRKKIPTVQEAIKCSQAVRDPLEGRREVVVHHPSICMKKNRQAIVPKPFTLNLSHPSLWVHGACAGGMLSCGGPQYDDGLEYEFPLPPGSTPKHGIFIHVHRSLFKSLSCNRQGLSTVPNDKSFGSLLGYHAYSWCITGKPTF